MSQHLPHPDPDDTWQRNLSAIKQVDPDLANLLQNVAVPDGAELTTGRDGSPTYRIPGQDTDRWLGMTSMPTVSGPAVLRNFDLGSGNVALPGIGQGIETRLLVDQLGPSRAVIVLEQDPAALAMVLRLHDVSAALASRRLILIVPTEADAGAPIAPLTGALMRYLADHDGVIPPDRMLAWPWLSATQTDLLRMVLQRASAEITHQRTQALANLSATLADRYRDRVTDAPAKPSTLAVCLTPMAEACQIATQLVDSAGSHGWTAQAWLGNAPDRNTSLPLGRTIAQMQPDWVVLIDTVRGRLARVLPAGLRAVTWLTPWAQVDGEFVGGVGPDDRVATMTDRLAHHLVAAGLPADRVSVIPPGVLLRDQVAPASASCDVLAVADARATDAESNGLTLDSHRALWHAASRLIVDEAERYCDDDIERLLSRAEKKAGATFQDPNLRTDVQRHINAVLGQTLVRRKAYAAALKAGVPLTIRGRGWGDVDAVSSAWAGPVALAERAAAYASAKIVLHVDITGNTTPDTLLAAASGAVVVARAHPTDQANRGLTDLLEPGREILLFRKHSEMIGHIKRLLADEPARREMVDCARAKLAESHTMAHRLQELWELARGS